jgi:hypothetical protein
LLPALPADAALAGAGLAFVFEAQVEQLIARNKLTQVLADWYPAYPGFFVCPSRRLQRSRFIVRAQAGLLSVTRQWRQRWGDDRRRALPAGRHHLAFVHQTGRAVFHSRRQRPACAIVQT